MLGIWPLKSEKQIPVGLTTKIGYIFPVIFLVCSIWKCFKIGIQKVGK